MKNILILSSSPRKNGNSDILCEQFIKGAKESGHNTEKIYISDLKINYCKGCEVCNTTGECVQKDEMEKIYEKLLKADVIVFATPVYFYSMCGQMKVFIDRLVPIYTKLLNKEVYIIVTAWDSEKANLNSTLEAIRGLTRDCMEGTIEKGVILGSGSAEKGEVEKTPAYLEAYEMGRKA